MTASAEGETQALQNGDVEGETKITIQVGSLSPLFLESMSFIHVFIQGQLKSLKTPFSYKYMALNLTLASQV